jgi:APA family basic amino acid/polyamine antiporter
VRKTVTATRVVLVVVLAALAVAVLACVFGGTAGWSGFRDPGAAGVDGVLRSAGLLFFAFAGYARIATLAEEVEDPAVVIPKAIPRALGIALFVYAAVAVSALAAVGPAVLAGSEAPLAAAAGAGRFDAVVPIVRVGGTVAALGVLLSLLAGVGRTTFAMAADGELPRGLAAVHPVHRVPHRAELAVGALVAALVVVADLRDAIGFSSFCVLVYYAVANASALRLAPDERRWPRPLAVAGLAGCVVLAATLPVADVAAGAAVLAAGAVGRAASRIVRRSGQAQPPA